MQEPEWQARERQQAWAQGCPERASGESPWGECKPRCRCRRCCCLLRHLLLRHIEEREAEPPPPPPESAEQTLPALPGGGCRCCRCNRRR
ncbi:Hypothetical predicted protein, partial [Podarcis lilfordi]